MASWQTLSAAQVSSPPSAVPIEAFDAARHVSPVGEVRVNGIWLRDLGIGTIVKEGADDAYVVIKDAKGPDYAVLFFRHFEADQVETGLAALAETNGQITVAGFREADQADADAVTADLIARNLAAGPPMLLLKPYFGDRAAALRGRQTFESVTFAIIAGVNLIIGLIAFFKFRRWRARVAARTPATSIPRVSPAARPTTSQTFASVPKPVATIRASATATPTKPRDPFANGPVHSPKGWFR